MIGNQIDQFTRQGSEKVTGAVLTMLLALRAARADVLLPAHDPSGRRRGGRGMTLAPEPVGQAALARGRDRASTSSGRSCRSRSRSLFAFNNGRSRTTWQGFSFRWFTGSDGQRVPRSGPAGRPQAHAAPGRDLRRRRDAARRRARARPAALAGRGRRHDQHADAAPARDAGDRHGRRAPAPLPARLPRDRLSERRPRRSAR